jgi:hypothetical protein
MQSTFVDYKLSRFISLDMEISIPRSTTVCQEAKLKGVQGVLKRRYYLHIYGYGYESR